MRTTLIALFLTGILVSGACLAGEHHDVPPHAAMEVDIVSPYDPYDAVDDVSSYDAAAVPEYVYPAPTDQEPSNWEIFKSDSKQLGGAVASGTRNAAEKTADAVVYGARKTGQFFSSGYQSAKKYIHEKTE